MKPNPHCIHSRGFRASDLGRGPPPAGLPTTTEAGSRPQRRTGWLQYTLDITAITLAIAVLLGSDVATDTVSTMALIADVAGVVQSGIQVGKRGEGGVLRRAHPIDRGRLREIVINGRIGGAVRSSQTVGEHVLGIELTE